MEKNGQSKRARWPYVLAAGYLVMSYVHIVLGAFASRIPFLENLPAGLFLWLPPVIYGIINLIVMVTAGRNIDRNQLLNCVVLIKYSLIPLYLIGGTLVVLCLVFMFIPVPFMIFVGAMAAFSLGVIGWMILACAAPYSIAYIVKASKEGILGIVWAVLCSILQFFFVADVIVIMILAFRERRWRKLTITVIIMLALLAAALVIGLLALIMAAAASLAG